MPRLLQRSFCSFLLLASFYWATLSAAEKADRPIVLAVHPYLPYQELQKRYQPLASYLKRVLGTKVVVRIGRDYSEHIAHIGTDRVDIAYLGPATYVRMVDKYGQKPLLARLEVGGKPFFHGYLVTRSGSGVGAIENLREKRFAFGDPASTMSHLVPRHMLLEAGLDVDDLADYQFLGSHKNVALAVLSGAFDAGAVKEEVMESFKSRGLRSFAKSAPYSEHIFVARSDADDEFVVTVKKALFGLAETAEGRGILRSIKQGVTGLVPVEDAHYDNLRSVLKSLSAHGVE
ncbi:MAG: phosphate/phosphite/phosphonate ABC transporter substrate-binding protein [Gammaproteobacteria bacterium]|nr:phosphate/phosphite/phosphonate ABC transporter substrate-binding protein [Gammaproteobacteria bacterium]